MAAIAYGNGMFVQVGNDGRIETSMDGAKWTPQISNTVVDLNQVIWNGKRYVANVDDPYIKALYSDDGVNWKTTDMNATKCFSIEVASNGSNFIMVTQNAIGNAPKPGAFLGHRLFNNYIFTSTAGVSWTEITPSIYYGIAPNDAVQFKNEIYTVGEHGGMMHLTIE